MKTQLNIAIFLAAVLIALLAYNSFQRLTLQHEALDLREQEIKFREAIVQTRLDAPAKAAYTIVRVADGKIYLLDSSTGRTWYWNDFAMLPGRGGLVVQQGWEQTLFWADQYTATTTPAEDAVINEEWQKRANVLRREDLEKRAKQAGEADSKLTK